MMDEFYEYVLRHVTTWRGDIVCSLRTPRFVVVPMRLWWQVSRIYDHWWYICSIRTHTHGHTCVPVLLKLDAFSDMFGPNRGQNPPTGANLFAIPCFVQIENQLRMILKVVLVIHLKDTEIIQIISPLETVYTKYNLQNICNTVILNHTFIIWLGQLLRYLLTRESFKNV